MAAEVIVQPSEQGDTPTGEVPDLSVVIPTYRQSEVIGRQVSEVLRALDDLGCEYEVLVVVDGDEDCTAAALATIAHERLRVAVQERNSGKGEAVRRGLLAVGGRARAFLDGGGDIPPRCLVEAYRLHLASGSDIVVGSKLHARSVVE